ncbi:MAG: hypothetical protein WC770_02130 [Phycisphaerae bacterium]|jgi:hypothetical protein
MKNGPEFKLYTKAEIRRLKQLYPMTHNKDIAKILGRTTASVLSKAKKLGIKKDWAGGYRVPQPPQNENPWTKDEIGELRRMYLNLSNGDIAKKLNRTKQAVQAKTRKLKLFGEFKEQGLVRKTGSGVNRWSDSEIDILKKLYPEKSKDYIAKKLGRTKKAVEVMGRRLKLTSNAPRKNSWTIEEDTFIEEHIAKWPIEKIAEKLGKTFNAIQRRAWKKHFTRNCPNKHHTQEKFWTNQELKQLEHWHGKLSKKAIAAKLGRSVQSVKAKAKHIGLRKPPIWTAKNIAILKKYFPFETNPQVAKRIGTNPSSIRLKAIEFGLKRSIYAAGKKMAPLSISRNIKQRLKK